MVELWGRYIELQIGNTVFSNGDFDIGFKVENTTGSEAGSAEITIYNLTNTTKTKIKKDEPIQLKAGYESLGYGIIFLGKIDRVHDKTEGADVKTTIEALDAMIDLLKGEHIRKFSPEGALVSTIIKELFITAGVAIGTIEDCGVTLDNIFMEEGTPYAIAERYADFVNGEIKKMGREDIWGIYIENNTGFFVAEDVKLTIEAIVLSSETGLISVLKNEDEDAGIDYSIKTLLQWKIASNSILQLESKNITGIFKVINYKHIASNNNYYTEAEIKAV